jgi:acetyltransferase-like isoleucine patch superfamily enzyme
MNGALARFWNGRPAGIPATLLEVLSALLGNLGGRISTLLWTRNFAACGPGSRVYWKPAIRWPGNIRLGAGVILAPGVTLNSETSDGRLEIADRVWIGAGSQIDFSGFVRIGEDTTLSPGVVIYSHSHGRNPRSLPTGCDVRIGRGVWIGAGAVILQGVAEIPDGCIVGAGAVVTRSPEVGQIIVGNPGRPLPARPADQ